MSEADHITTLLVGDCREHLRSLPAGIARTCVTSPPYWGLRDYGVDGQMGMEQTPDEYVAGMVDVFREVRRVLADDGTLWLNIGDSYAAKNLVGIPWMVAFALRADGWYLRSDIIWHKPNPMPEPVKDRPTKSHEHVFLLAKSDRYFYDIDAVREPHATLTDPRYASTPKNVIPADRRPKNGDGSKQGFGHMGFGKNGRNKRDVWTITPRPFRGAHFATMPPDLAQPCILAGSAPGDVVIDPFCGAGTTGLVARRLGRKFVGIELNPSYAQIARDRWSKEFAR